MTTNKDVDNTVMWFGSLIMWQLTASALWALVTVLVSLIIVVPMIAEWFSSGTQT